MLKDFLQIATFSPVFIGEFNPVIIQPFWLANKKLIREQEATDAKVEIIHNEIVRFSIDWATIEITKNRFEIRTSKEPFFEPVRDLAVSILEILKETPVTSVGINHVLHYSLDSPDHKIDRYYEFGNRLAPLDNWKGFLKDPRLLQLEIIDNEREDGKNGYIRVKVQTSELIKPRGIAIDINDHFSIKENETGRKGEMVNVFKENFKASFERANKFTESLWDKIKI